MKYSFTKHADRQLSKLPEKEQRRVVEKIKYYIDTGDPLRYAKMITGEKSKVYRFRVGDWRIIFEVLNGELRVLQVRPRPRAYGR